MSESEIQRLREQVAQLEQRLKVVRDAVQPNDAGPEFICLGENPEVCTALYDDRDFDQPAPTVQLERFGLEWSGPKEFVATPMADGYWTPWHIAQAAVEGRAANNIMPCQPAPTDEPCKWEYDTEDCAYSTDCGQYWIFNEGGPAENNTHFCHYCGGRIALQGEK